MLLNVVNYSNYATVLGNNDVVFSNAIVKMKRLRKTSHVADQQTLFFFLNYFYVSSHKHTNVKERYHAPLILSKEPKLSMLTVCYMYVELIPTIDTEFSVRCKHHMTVAKLRLSVKKKQKRTEVHFITFTLLNQ